MKPDHQTFMEHALQEAENAAQRGEVPVGAVITHHGKIIARAGNETNLLCDPSAHAEILAIRRACSLLQTPRLITCDLYITLEPCPMCASAIAPARLRRVYYATADPKGGAVEHGVRFFAQDSCFHKPELYVGLKETSAQRLLKDFFQSKRNNLTK